MTNVSRIPFSFLVLLAVGTVLAAGTASPVQAQQQSAQQQAPGVAASAAEEVSSTEKWYVHAHLGAHSQNVGNSDDVDGGGGFGLRVGYGVSPLATLYLGLDFAGMGAENPSTQNLFGDDYGLGTFEIGAQFNFRRDKKLVPYVETALTGVASVIDEGGTEASISGAGLGVGGGVKYFVAPEFAIDGGVHFNTGGYTDQEVNGESRDIDAVFGNGRLMVGVSWYPFQ